jgi:hypothetical protein
MPPVGFEPTISVGERPQTYALDRAVTGTGMRKWEGNIKMDLDDWLTVHRSITLVNFQLDAQNSLFIYIQYIY